MKKIFSILAVSAIMLTVACGPSAEDKAKRDKEVADSIANQEAMMMELETQKAQAMQDSLAAIEKMKADSLAADSVAKATAKKK
jgi:protein involved in sex pheromone biosynthesis